MEQTLIKLLSAHDFAHDLSNNRLIERLKHKKMYSGPHLYHGGEDYEVNRNGKNVRWYVYYSFEDPETGNLVRQDNIYLDINKVYKTKKDRLRRFKLVMDELEWMLENGYSPYKNAAHQKFYTSEAVLDFALSLKKTSLRATSYKDYESRVGQFKAYLDKKGLLQGAIKDVNKTVVQNYLNDVLKSSSPRNRNNTRSTLSAIFGVLEENDYIPRNVVAGIKKMKAEAVRNKSYSTQKTDEIFSYLDKENPNLFLFIKFVSYNFLRPIEVCRLRVGDIDLEEKRLYVRAKNKAVKLKIIPDIILKELQHLKDLPADWSVFTPGGMPGVWDTEETNKRNYFSKQYRKVKTVFELSNDYTVYSFRHTFITKLYKELRAKYSLSECLDKLMLITGHETLIALRNYLRDIDAELPEDYSEMLK